MSRFQLWWGTQAESHTCDTFHYLSIPPVNAFAVLLVLFGARPVWRFIPTYIPPVHALAVIRVLYGVRAVHLSRVVILPARHIVSTAPPLTVSVPCTAAATSPPYMRRLFISRSMRRYEEVSVSPLCSKRITWLLSLLRALRKHCRRFLKQRGQHIFPAASFFSMSFR